LDGFSAAASELAENNISVVAASSDAQDKAAEMAEQLGFPVGYGVDEAAASAIGGYWEGRRNFAQPAEFVINPAGKIVQLSYSDGPLARTEAGDVLKMVAFLEKQKQKS
jgi:peroxiredoxin